MATDGAVAGIDFSWLVHWLGWIWAQANGAFGIALVSALFGSFAGAYGAQFIAEREQRKRQSIQEIRGTNAAIALALFVLNALTAMKNQQLAGLVSRYKADAERHAEALHNPGTGAFHFTADWEVLPWTELPMDALNDAVFNKMDAQGRAISLLTLAAGSIGHLRSTISQRNDFIEETRRRQPLAPNDLAALYFGVRTAGGQTDRRYPGLIDAIGSYADSAILFAAVLTSELIHHGTAAAKTLGRSAPKINTADFRPAFQAGLIPDPMEFAEVLRAIGIDPATTLAEHRGG